MKFPPVLRQLLHSLLGNIHALNEQILATENSLAVLCQQQSKYKVLMTIPGIGPLFVSAFLSEENAEQFTNGRQLSVWCSLVPRPQHSGEKRSLPPMSKKEIVVSGG
ncbi:IS110 family transposase [Salmonella enterica]